MSETLKLKSSSQIHSGTYDPSERKLTLELNGGTYTYSGVTRRKVSGIESASSPGEYFHKNIRGKHEFVKH